MIHDIIGSGILVAVGAGVTWAAMASGRALDKHTLETVKADRDHWYARLLDEHSELHDAEAAHSRLSDAHNSTKERIERALECETANAAHGVRKMAAILRGER